MKRLEDPGTSRAAAPDLTAFRTPFAHPVDIDVAYAVHEAAVAIVSAPSFKEKLAHDALEPALEKRFGRERVHRTRSRRLAVLPDWHPQPQSIDVSVLDAADELRLAFELKVDDVRFTFWDMLKMAAATRLASVERGYLVVAASTWKSARSREAGRRYFPSSPGPPQIAPLAELFDEYRRVWQHDLAASSARPTRFPEALELTHVATATVPSWPNYEIRAVGVRDAGRTYRAAEAGWPLGIGP
jgi:hypothetical protein